MARKRDLTGVFVFGTFAGAFALLAVLSWTLFWPIDPVYATPSIVFTSVTFVYIALAVVSARKKR